MGAFGIRAGVLTTVLTIAPILLAQTTTAPEITLPAGDATRGKAIFESSKGNCLNCHRVNGSGSRFGPELSTIGAPPRGGGGAGGRGGGAAPAAAAGRGTAVPPVLAANATDTMLRQFAQSILDPNALVTVQNRYVQLKMKDGKTISGKLLSVDTFYYQIFDSTEKLANISKDTVREMIMTSPMPSYRDRLSTQELADVISYLMSLKGQ
jgi:putative heme-binding domain-containing protein